MAAAVTVRAALNFNHIEGKKAPQKRGNVNALVGLAS